jgi:hypothetical protein
MGGAVKGFGRPDNALEGPSGQIDSDEPGLAEKLHDVLGLNVSKLVNNRRQVIIRLEQFANRHAPKNAPPTWFAKQLEKLAARSDTELDPFVQVAEHWLRRHARRRVDRSNRR